MEIIVCGSSPRVWGKLESGIWESVLDRFIPTRVGKAENMSCFFHVKPVHPHACGESINHQTLREMSPGSSPRVWGKLHVGETKKNSVRFIPTRVGKALVKSTSYKIKIKKNPEKGRVFSVIFVRGCDQLNAGEFDGIPTTHSIMSEPFDGVALAVGTGGDADESKAQRRITLYVADDIIMCSFVQCSHKHIRTWFDKPAF